MLIKCPRCRTTAKLSASQEGAKVRCGSCERVFVAHPMGERGGRTQNGVPPAAIIAGAVLVVAVVLMVVLRGEEPKDTLAREITPKVAAPEAVQAVEVDPYSYEGEVTQFCIAVHELIFASDRGVLRSRLSGEDLLARELEAQGSAPASFANLSSTERAAHLERWAEDLITGKSSEYIRNWKPYDSEVKQYDEDRAEVHLSVTSRDEDDTSQLVVIWNLVRPAGQWKLAGWQRYEAPVVARPESYAVSSQGLQKVVQEDGSVVVEREPEALPHLPETPPELRARIDALYATMVDLDLTREANAARDELVEIGKPAVPKLLTGLFETRLDTPDESIKANIIVVALRNITGKNMGYQPMALSGQKNTEEYRQSAVRQWFAWWYRFGPKFMERREGKDALEDYIELSDKEKRALERDRKRNR